MENKSMQKLLKSGEAIDVRKIGTTTIDNNVTVFNLNLFIDNKDYCDALTESWIWSIGKRYADGMIFASVDTRYYDNPEYECLWLR